MTEIDGRHLATEYLDIAPSARQHALAVLPCFGANSFIKLLSRAGSGSSTEMEIAQIFSVANVFLMGKLEFFFRVLRTIFAEHKLD
jgi:hypothetical protein